MGLFKYCSESGLLVLKNLEIKLTPPIDFNDPFEFSPVVVSKDPKGYELREAKKVITDPTFFNAHRSEFPGCRNFQEFQAHVRANLGKVITTMVAETPKLDTQLEVLDTLSHKFGVICFSADPAHLLMWAHYASSHKGLVLEFDQADPVFNLDSFLKVDYDAVRAEYDPTGSNPRGAVELFAKRKSLDWEYEQEFRLILDLSLARKQVNGGQVIYLFKIEPKLLKSVTIGLRATAPTRDEIMSLTSKAPLDHLEVFQIEADQHNFKLHRRRIK